MPWKRNLLVTMSRTRHRYLHQQYKCSHYEDRISGRASLSFSSNSASAQNHNQPCHAHIIYKPIRTHNGQWALSGTFSNSLRTSFTSSGGCCQFSNNLMHHRMQSHRHYPMVSEVGESVSLKDVFSDANKKRAQARLETVKPVRNVDTVAMKKEVKVSAVLIPLCLVDGEPSILFTLRSSTLRKHRGEVSFPGGNQDKEDIDIVHTALRETFEELGLNPRHFDVWGHLQPTPDRRGKRLIYPVLARYTKDLDISSLTLSADEVEEVFSCRIQDLCDMTKIASTQFRTGPGYTLPVFLSGPHRIWGLTAVILHHILTLLAPGLYMFKLRHIS